MSDGSKKDTQRDKTGRPQPPLDPVEGDRETIEEDLREKEKGQQKKK